MSRFTYRVDYRRGDLRTRRVYHRTVIAASADDARAVVAALDPQYIGTVRSPRRLAEIVPAVR